MNNQFKAIAIFAILVVIQISGQQGNCHGQSYTYDDDFLPRIILDDSHDLVRLIKDYDELEIEIYMFDANDFDSVPNTQDL